MNTGNGSAHHCSNCNEEIQSNMKFCPICGAKQETLREQTAANICLHCNMEIAPTVKFCPYCGAPQTPQREVTAPIYQESPFQGYSPTYTPQGDIGDQKETLPSLENAELAKKPNYKDLGFILLPAIVWILIETFLNSVGLFSVIILIQAYTGFMGIDTDNWSDSTVNLVNLGFNVFIDTLAIIFILAFLLKRIGLNKSDIGINDKLKSLNPKGVFFGFVAAFGLTYFIGIFLQVVINGIWEILGWSTEQDTPYDDYLDGADPALMLLFLFMLVVMAPITEEIIYRGLIMRLLLDRGFSPYSTVIVSSAIFAVVHTEADIVRGTINYAIFHFASTFIIGAALAVSYLYTKNLGVPILIHAINNGFAGVAMIVYLDSDPNNPSSIIIGLALVTLSLLGTFCVLIFKHWQSVKIILDNLKIGLKNSLNQAAAMIFGLVALVAVVIPVTLELISQNSESFESYSPLIWVGLNFLIFIICLTKLTPSKSSQYEQEN